MKAKKTSINYGGKPKATINALPVPVTLKEAKAKSFWDPKPAKPKPISHADKQIRLLTSILAAVGKTNELLTAGSGGQGVSLADLKKVEKTIMAEVAVVVGQLNEAIASAKQTNLDIAEVQKVVNEQKTKIQELTDLVSAGGVSQEIADKVTEVRDLNKQVDEGLPNPIVIPPVDPPVDPQARRR